MNFEVRKLEAEKVDCEELVRKAQEGASRQLKAGKSIPREDNAI